MDREAPSNSYSLCAVILLDGSDVQKGKEFNELDEQYHRNKVNGSITIHYSQGIRAKIHATQVK